MIKAPEFDYIRCSLKRYTFQIKPIREWVKNTDQETGI